MAGDEHVADIVIVDGRVETRPPTTAEGERETPLDLAALRRIAEAATPGIWSWRDSAGLFVAPGPPVEGSDPPRLYPYGKAVLLAQYEYDTGADIDASDEDRAHIAAFNPQTALRLLAEATRLTAERDALVAIDKAHRRAWDAVRDGLEPDAYRAGKWDLDQAIRHRIAEVEGERETAERERDKALDQWNAALTERNRLLHAPGTGTVRAMRAEAERDEARAERDALAQQVETLRQALRAINPLMLIEGTEDGFHQYRCVACHRGSRPDHADARHFDSCIFYGHALTAPADPTGGQ